TVHEDVGDTACKREEGALGYGKAECVVCTSYAEKARACCRHEQGVDCRAWPFPHDSAVHQLCARHEDCQLGLLCKGDAKHASYGLCLCPETLIQQVTEGDACQQALP